MPLELKPGDKHAVRCTSISMPTPELIESGEVSTPEQLLAFYARVSATANQGKHETGAKLIRSLIKREEWSPLEMVNACCEIITTRDIARQILRHTVLRPQEFSQRYAKVTMDPILSECRFQDPVDRQGSLEVDERDSAQMQVAYWWEYAQQDVWDKAIDTYNMALQKGIAKEQARKVLPEGLTPTRTYFNGPLRGWYHYTKLRTKLSTQKEHRLIAQDCWSAILKHFPSMAVEA